MVSWIHLALWCCPIEPNPLPLLQFGIQPLADPLCLQIWENARLFYSGTDEHDVEIREMADGFEVWCLCVVAVTGYVPFPGAGRCLL
jgi:hypothetical protein